MAILKNKKNWHVGFTAGVFDLFHIGHLNILRNAKALCDKLIVAVSTDELVFEYKKRKPIVPYSERAEIIRSIRFVDSVIPQDNRDKYQLWKKLKFDVMFVGDDWYNDPHWKKLEKKLKKVGVEIIYFPYTKYTSTTSRINEIIARFSKNDEKEQKKEKNNKDI
jgi:glycerol-3-phosphate cytidylyltransferase